MKKSFGKEYFSDYYFRNVGNFDQISLKKAKNWFWGWMSYLQRFVDLEKGSGKRILEIGCSIGGVSHLLWERGFKVYASDVSSYALKRAEKLAKKLKRNISFYTFDIEQGIPVEGKFDLIIAFEVIEHLERPLVAISYMKKKLGRDGILVCSTPNACSDLSEDPTHINVKNKTEWEKIFLKAGFKDIKMTQVSFLPFFYKFSKYFHIVLPLAIKSRYINSPLFIIARN